MIVHSANPSDGSSQEPPRAISPEALPDAPLEVSERNDFALRPTLLDEYIGQSELKRNLSVFLQASKNRDECLEHVLLHGPPGLGKTTLAHIISREMKTNIRITSGPALERQGDVAAIITNLQEGDVLFIDEIHRLKPVVEEVLYSAMEDFAIDLILGKGASARSMRLNLPRFTLIGATTKLSLLSSPLRDRFGHLFRLEYYSHAEIEQIIHRSSNLLEVDIHSSAVERLAVSSRQTPRIANRLLRRIRDFASVNGSTQIDFNLVNRALADMGIDEQGLDEADRSILRLIIERFRGGPVGLSTISAATGEEAETIEDIYEPFLMQKGFLERTARGRMVTPRGYEHFGLEIEPSNR